jgi:hypothetical protein
MRDFSWYGLELCSNCIVCLILLIDACDFELALSSISIALDGGQLAR